MIEKGRTQANEESFESSRTSCCGVRNSIVESGIVASSEEEDESENESEDELAESSTP